MTLWNNPKAKHGSYAALFIIIMLSALIILNIFVQKLDLQADMTKRGLFSLSDKSLSVLSKLEKQTTIYALYKAGQEKAQIIEVLQKYEGQSSLLNVITIDPDRVPALMEKYRGEGEELSLGSLILENADNFRIIPYFDLYDMSMNQSGETQIMGMLVEQKVTSALEYIGSGYTPVIYELTGHKEMTLDFLGLSEDINNENYIIRQLNLQTEGRIPDDAGMVLSIGPESDLLETEAEALQLYAESGGKLLLMFDYTEKDLTIYNQFMNSYGLSLSKGIVLEKDLKRIPQVFGDVPTIYAPSMMAHAITDPLKESGLDVVLPGSLGLTILKNKKKTLKITPVLSSSGASFLRTDTQNMTEDKIKSDFSGPILNAVTVTRIKQEMNEAEGFKIMVCTSASMLRALPYVGKIKGNIEFFLNALTWTVSQDEELTIPSKSFYKLPMRMSSFQAYIYAALIVVVIPLLLLLTGLIIWLKRRHL